MAVVTLKGADLPGYHELFRLHMDGGVLLFEPAMAVELRLREGLQTTETIMRDGLAARSDAGWRLPLVVGSKGAVRFGELALLFKLRARREAPLKAVRQADPTPCGTCGTPMPWAITGFGALCPCANCGTLNEVQIDSGAPEDRRTQMAKAIRKKSTDLPTFDAISLKKGTDLPSFDGIAMKKGTDLPTFDAISVKKGADLPTFDSISVGKHADLPTFDAIGVLEEGSLEAENLRLSQEEQSAPTRRMPLSEQLSGPQDISKPPPDRFRGADLPTFDAISVLKPSDSKLTETAPMRRKVPVASGAPPELVTTDVPPPIHSTEMFDIATGEPVPPKPLTEDSLKPKASAPVMAEIVQEEQDFFGEEFLVDLEQQKSFVSVPILKQPDLRQDQLTPEEIAAGAQTTRRVPTRPAPPAPGLGRTPPPPSSGVPPGVTPPPHGLGAAPAAQDQVHGRPSGFLRNEVPPPKPPLPPLDESLHGEDVEEGTDADDFLMGRSDLPSPQSNSNRWLLMIGTIAGVSGVALILYKLLLG